MRRVEMGFIPVSLEVNLNTYGNFKYSDLFIAHSNHSLHKGKGLPFCIHFVHFAIAFAENPYQ